MVGGSSTGRGERSLSRRRFVKAVGASGVAVGLAGCSNNGDGDGGGGGGGGGDGGDGGGGGGTTVEWAVDSLVADNGDAITQALHDAGLSEDIDIEYLGGSQNTEDRQSQYQQWLSSGQETPDLLMMDSGWTIPFIVRGQLQNMEEVLSSDQVDTVKNDYFEATVSTVTDRQGTLFGVPLFSNFPTMLYRKDLVEEAGYDPEGENWASESITWQKFSEVVSTVQQENDMDMGFTFQAAEYEGLACCTFNEFLTGWGGSYFGDHENLFGPVGDRPVTVTEQSVIDSIRMIRAFIHGNDADNALGEDQVTGNISPDAVLQWIEDDSLQPFQNGNAVAHRNWPYAINQAGADEALGEDLGVMPIPYAVSGDEAQYEGTGGPVAALGDWHVSMNPNSQRQDAARQVIEALMQDDFMVSLLEITGFLPPKPSVLDSDEASNVEVIGRHLDAVKVAGENAIPRPVTVAWPDQSTRISQEAHAAYSGGKAPQQAMSDLQGALEQIEQEAAQQQ